VKEKQNLKKELQIDHMGNEEVMNELKDKKLPTFGTPAERKDRLKKHYGNFKELSNELFRHWSCISLICCK